MFGFRDNENADAEDIYRSTPTGWEKVDLGWTIQFSNLQDEISEGDTLTQGFASGTVERWIITSGDIQSGVNTGYFVLSGVGGDFFAAGAALVGAVVVTRRRRNSNHPESGWEYNFTIGNFSGYYDNRACLWCRRGE